MDFSEIINMIIVGILASLFGMKNFKESEKEQGLMSYGFDLLGLIGIE